jgi:hypothetical protein
VVDSDKHRADRRIAMDHVIAAIAGSPQAEHLVLRGSALLRAWYGDAAREPGDLDFVVVPRSLPIGSPESDALEQGIIDAVAARITDGITFERRVDRYDIYWYERAPGRQIVFRWYAPGGVPEAVSVDLVFNEEIPEPPVSTVLPIDGGASSVTMAAATPEMALAWKILWLDSDMYPELKDLFDAALLAEHVTVPLPLLRAIMLPWYGNDIDSFGPDRVRDWTFNWSFLSHHNPWLVGDPWRLLEPIEDSLARSFTQADQAASE